MKRKRIILTLLLIVTVILFACGIGPHSNASAIQDLKAELETIYGPEYTGKLVENGSEDMEFVVQPTTWILTNWNLRNALSLDYHYECQVVFTVHTGKAAKIIRTITYQAIDPMGSDDLAVRAHLILDSRT